MEGWGQVKPDRHDQVECALNQAAWVISAFLIGCAIGFNLALN